MKCPYCESENIEKGSLGAAGDSVMFSLTNKSFFQPSRHTPVSAQVCLECGKLFDFEVDYLYKLNRTNSK